MFRLINYLTSIILIITISNSVSAQTTCGMPDLLTFGTNQNISSVTPYWDPVPGATSYNLQYRIRNISAPYSSSISTNTASLTLTNLTPSTNYEFIVQSVCAAGTSAFSSSGWFTTAGGASSAAIIRGPYLTVATSSSVTIQWRTDVLCSSEVMYGTSMNNLSYFLNFAANSTNHTVTLTNLHPNTKYYYSIGVIGTSIESTSENFFYTAPADNDTIPTRFWVTGDFGVGGSPQRAVRDAFLNYTSGQKVNGWLWLGDNAYSNGTDQEYQDKVFDIYPSQFKNIPVFPALGNHDYAQSGYQSAASLGTGFPYFDIFKLPANSGTEKYYSTNYGNVHLIALDSYGSYNSSTSDMYHWLENDLNTNTKQWTVVYFHHPPYSKGSHDSDNSTEMVDMRNNIIPLLESKGVDLVLSGHSHAYERSYFIKGHYGKENTFNSSYKVQPGGGPYTKTTRTGNGTVYAVCGVSGQVSATTSGYPHNAMFYSNANKFGSLILDFTSTSLTGQFLTSTGTILDDFTITKPAISVIGIDDINGGGDLNFKIFPNPANQEFNIQLNEINGKSNKIQIFNLFGQKVYEIKTDINVNSSIIKISKNDFTNCSPGIYYVSLTNENHTSTQPLIIE